jgi:hypothetical protein
MSITLSRIGLAAAIGVLSSPVLAADEAPAAKRDCSVCGDPTWPDLRTPAPAFDFGVRPDGELAAAPRDGTWPEVREPAPAVALRPAAGDGPAVVQGDPTWPEMATAAPALHVGGDRANERIAHSSR